MVQGGDSYQETLSIVRYWIKPQKWLIVINEIHQISRKKFDFAKLTKTWSEFRKLQEPIWLTVINKIFKVPPHFNPFG